MQRALSLLLCLLAVRHAQTRTLTQTDYSSASTTAAIPPGFLGSLANGTDLGGGSSLAVVTAASLAGLDQASFSALQASHPTPC